MGTSSEETMASTTLVTTSSEETMASTTVVTTSSEETMASTTVVTTSSEPETEPEDETSSMPPASPSQCGSCVGCMWSHGLCYMDASKSYCESWSDNTWCGASLAQVQRHTSKSSKFLGLGLIQDGAWAARGVVDEL